MFGLSQDEWQDLVLSVNVRRKQRRLSPFQAAQLLKRALHSADLDAIAKALGSQDTTTLQKILRLTTLPEEYAALVEWGTRRGTVSMSTAAELLRLADPQSVPEVFKAAVERDLTKEEARQIIQIRQRSGRPVAECIEQALLTRPRVERHELIIGSLLTDKAREIVAQAGPETVTKKLKVALARSYPAIVAQAVRVGTERFSIMFASAQAEAFRQALHPESVEAAVTRLTEGLALAPEPKS